MEVCDDTFSHHFAYSIDMCQFVERCRHQLVNILEMSCEQFCRCLAHKPYSEGEHHSFERHLFRSLYSVNNLPCRLFPASVAVNLLYVDVVEVCYVFHQSMTIVVVNGFWAERLYIHSLAGYEVFNASPYLWRASCIVWAIVYSLSFISYQWCATLWTNFCEGNGYCIGVSVVGIHSYNFWYYLTTFFHKDIVSKM